jgi:hypothetical protein
MAQYFKSKNYPGNFYMQRPHNVLHVAFESGTDERAIVNIMPKNYITQHEEYKHFVIKPSPPDFAECSEEEFAHALEVAMGILELPNLKNL